MGREKSCVFCGRSDGKISKEHAWPNWVRKLFPGGSSVVVGFREPGGQLGDLRFAKSNDMGLVTNVVCSACNSGWMSNLENAIESLWTGSIRDGTPILLTEDQQVLTARWALKTAMVFEFTSTELPFHTFDERNALQKGEPPDELWTMIWLGRYAGDEMARCGGAGIQADIKIADGSIVPVSCRCSTVSLGRLAFQVLTVHPSGPVPRLELLMNDRWEDQLTELWPRTGTKAGWPPEGDIGDGMFPDLVKRLEASAFTVRTR